MEEEKKAYGKSNGSAQFRQLLIKNLKMYRKKCGYSQIKLAHLCSVSPNYIGEIEMGRKFPSADMMDKITFALNLKPYQLFFSEEDLSGVDEILKGHYDQVKTDLVSYVEEALKTYQVQPRSYETDSQTNQDENLTMKASKKRAKPTDEDK